MAKNKTDEYGNVTHTEKSNKKAGATALIVCLIISFLVWCYAKGDSMIKAENENNAGGNVAPAAQSAEDNNG